MATPEFETSKTFVWWDMNSCPLPLGYDPSRVGPRIDTELKKLGYNGPLTIIGVGDLEGVPHGFLNNHSFSFIFFLNFRAQNLDFQLACRIQHD
ncbi:unnamed protein product [Eruca vesicaria subsp. sativa]|uniref:NYN domain-containing protein n=1 Tax=Eruca vesicaria subsp. sativa TaxID=29727 RepID=A0ABC8IPI9_ERUVS|nr:unnamed protein product [Eruca vesicaria subsp. sativa]